ncbi:MAG: putative lipid II flippase FtsW [Candidatus Eremiobacteraeota bacterium]|nr:putative lipid II flippase FtsW [Candidatus Eremiobacteraeota bacterium]
MKKSPDLLIVFLTYTLLILGVIIVFSASSVTSSVLEECNNDPFFYLKRQIIWALLGSACFFAAGRVDLFKLRRASLIGVFFSIILLVLVLIPGIGHETMGARRWMGFGSFTFQPAEIAKVFFVIYLADYLSRRNEKITEFIRLLPVIGFAGIIIVLIEKEPDLGTSLVIGATMMGMLFMAGAQLKHLVALSVSGVMVVGIRILDEGYRVKRFLSFINPWADPLGSGYHIIQSLIALGSGGIGGLGLGQSRQKFFYLPEQYTDFIFAIIGEELGLLGTLAVVILFAALLYRGFKVAYAASHPYLKLLAAGCTFVIALQAFMNMGVVIGMLPCTGIPLPFISFGGSSLLTCLTLMGLLVNISQYCPRRTARVPISARGETEALPRHEPAAEQEAGAHVSEAAEREASEGEIAEELPPVPESAVQEEKEVVQAPQ